MIEGLEPTYENGRNKYYLEFVNASWESRRIWEEIEKIFMSAHDVADAEKIIEEEWALLYEQALLNEHRLLKKWLDNVNGK